MGSLADFTNSATQSIGRYFSVVSVIPSSLLVTFSYLLIASGSLEAQPNWSHALESLTHPGLGGLGALTFASIAIALTLHPIQFAIVQFYEGYWGNWDIFQRLRIQRIMRYRRIYQELQTRQVEAANWLDDLRGLESPMAVGVRVALESIGDEATRTIEAAFPRAQDDIMPTRLGNAMRRFERQAGEQYGLDAPSVFPHLLLVAPPDHVAYVNDQRS